MQQLRILHSDPEFVVLEKPAGLQVHPPEDPAHSGDAVDVIRILRRQLGQRVFPVHRLDRATQGVMLMALSAEVAALFQARFQAREVQKKYLLLCRGWLGDSGVFDRALRSDQMEGGLQESRTLYRTLHRFEIPVSDGRFSSSRYSLMMALPETGRYHQIRRHFQGASHPLIGDTVYGDGRHNRVWRELLAEKKLFLLSWQVSFPHPRSGKRMVFRARFTRPWHALFDQAGVCPVLSDQDA